MRVPLGDNGRKHCGNCGIALDVGGGCGACKPHKPKTAQAEQTMKSEEWLVLANLALNASNQAKRDGLLAYAAKLQDIAAKVRHRYHAAKEGRSIP